MAVETSDPQHEPPAPRTEPERDEATRLLARIEDGDPLAAEKLLPIVYAELRSRAAAYFRGPLANQTLQPTSLVHEAYMRLIRSSSGWNDRAHFCAIAATAMRQILMNHAAAKRADKRTPLGEQVMIDDVTTPAATPAIDLIALDDALVKLKEIDELDASIVELRFFAGITVDEVARIKGLSTRAIEKRWRRTRAWLNRELGGNDISESSPVF